MNVLKPGDVAFDPSVTPVADPLSHSKVAPKPPTNSEVYANPDLSNQYLFDRVKTAILGSGKYMTPGLQLEGVRDWPLSPIENALLPKTIELIPSSMPLRGFLIQLGSCDGKDIQDHFIGCFGEDIAQTQAFTYLRVTAGTVFSHYRSVDEYFGTNFHRNEGRYIPFTHDPYLTILTLPRLYRPFVLGATEIALEQRPQLVREEYPITPRPLFPLTFEDMFRFGQRANRLSDVGQIMDSYLSTKRNFQV